MYPSGGRKKLYICEKRWTAWIFFIFFCLFVCLFVGHLIQIDCSLLTLQMQYDCCTSHKTQQHTCIRCWPKRYRQASKPASRKWFTKNPINILHFIWFGYKLERTLAVPWKIDWTRGRWKKMSSDWESEVLFDFEMMMSIYMKKKIWANIWYTWKSVHLKCDWMRKAWELKTKQFTTNSIGNINTFQQQQQQQKVRKKERKRASKMETKIESMVMCGFRWFTESAVRFEVSHQKYLW